MPVLKSFHKYILFKLFPLYSINSGLISYKNLANILQENDATKQYKHESAIHATRGEK